jgi:large subunit ribosomal protein L24
VKEMRTAWAKKWNASKQPRKQRKYRHNAPMHTKVKLLHAHLSKDLHKKYGKSSLGIRTGDKVKVLVGDAKGKEVKVSSVDVKKMSVFLESIDRTKMDGSKAMIQFQASNLMITALGKEDKRIKKAKKEMKAKNERQ